MVFEIKLKNSLLALSAFPAVIGVIGMVFLLHILPISGAGFFYNYDPAYTYLLNGLTMLDGNAPDHIDHPGTPLQILVAIVVFIRWLIAGINPDMVADAIENPEAYIASVSWVLLALNVGAAFYFGKKVYAATGSFVSAMICQSAPVLFLATAVRVVYLSPEALLLFFSMILLGMLAPIFFSSDAKNINTAKVSPVAVGLVSGFGIAAKITFLPMLPLLFLLGSRKKIFKSGVYVAIGFLLMVLPALPNADKFFAWIIKLTLGSELYGHGSQTVINFSSIPRKIYDLLRFFSLFYFTMILLAISMYFIVYDKKIKSLVDWKIPAVIISVAFLSTLLVVKHFNLYYMIAVLPVGLVGFVWLVRSYALLGIANYSSSRILSIYLMAVIFSSLYATFANIKIINSDRQYQSSAFEKIENVISEYPDAILIGTYLCSLPECPFADSIKFTPTMNDRVVKKLNDFIYFEVDYAKLFYPGIGRKSVESINSYLESGRDVLLVSHNYYALDMLKLEPLVKTNGQSLYRVLGVTGIECPEPDHRDVKKRDKCLSRFLSNNPKTSQPSAGN